MKGYMEHINPDGLVKNPNFSQIVTTQGDGRTIYIGGQNAVNAQREIIGQGDIALQTEQVMHNLQAALRACGANYNNLVKLTIYILQGQNLYSAFQTSQRFLNGLADPPVISVLIVAGLANPDFLIEIDAIAFIST